MEQKMKKGYNEALCSLILDYPELAKIILSIGGIAFDKDLPFSVAATDGKKIIVNPLMEQTLFNRNLSEKERMFVLAHEVMHLIFLTFPREKKRDRKLWNMATDFVNNGLLKKDNFKLVDGCLYDPQFDGKSAEQVYASLIKEYNHYKQEDNGSRDNKKDNGEGKGNEDKNQGNEETGPCDLERLKKHGFGRKEIDSHDFFDELSDEDKEKLVQRIREALQSTQGFSRRGSDLTEKMLEMLPPIKFPWKKILNKYIKAFGGKRFSWKIPSKKSIDPFYLPSLQKGRGIAMNIAIDVSGSTESYWKDFMGHILKLLKSFDSVKLNLVTFSTKIGDEFFLTKEDLKNKKKINEILEIKTDGGTHIPVVFEYWNKRKAERDGDINIIFTDGYSDFGGIKFKGEVIWAIADNKNFTLPEVNIKRQRILKID